MALSTPPTLRTFAQTNFLCGACQQAVPHLLVPGTWPHEVDVVDGKIVVTKKDGSVLSISYSSATSPAEVRGVCHLNIEQAPFQGIIIL